MSDLDEAYQMGYEEGIGTGVASCPDREQPGETTTGVASTTTFNERLDVALFDLSELLKERHGHHGDAVFEPEAIFSQISPKERIHVMLDYKLARYRQGSSELRGENLDDMLGYLLLLKILEQ